MVNIKIKGTGINTKIYVNGNEVKGVSEYVLSQKAGQSAEIKLTIYAHELTIDTPAIPALPSIYRSTYVRRKEVEPLADDTTSK